MRDVLLAEFDHEMAATRRVLACIPADRLDWTPHERSRSIGALVGHVCEVLSWSGPILDEPHFDFSEAADIASMVPGSRDDLLRAFADAAAQARKRLDRSNAELSAMWSLLRNGEEIFSLPRAAAFRSFVLAHVVHHRGQLSVYLRLNGIPVPALYGPTADSGTLWPASTSGSPPRSSPVA